MYSERMIAIIDNIRSLHNVGSIFRTADGAGIEKIYLSGITPSPVDRVGEYRSQISKVALGAEKVVPWEKVTSTSRLITRLKKEGHQVIALEQTKNSISYLKYKKPKNKKIVFIVGNEVKGIFKSVLAKCDKIIEIPMKGKKKSLNVAVSFGIAAYHLNK